MIDSSSSSFCQKDINNKIFLGEREFAEVNLTVIHYGSTLPAPRACAHTIIPQPQRGFSDPPFRQECLAHARGRNRCAPQPRAPDPPVPAHVLDSQYRLGLVAPRFEARPRKGHDRAALPVRVRAGDEQLLGRAATAATTAEGRITCKMRTTRERAMRRNVARPKPSVRWSRQRPARCQAGRSAGASPDFLGDEVHFVTLTPSTFFYFMFSLMKEEGQVSKPVSKRGERAGGVVAAARGW